MGALNSKIIPEVINKFDIYSTTTGVLLGVTGEIKLPSLENLSAEVSGAGVMGKYKTPLLGHFESTQMDINFRAYDDDVFNLIDPSYPVELTLRASFQSTVRSTGGTTYIPLRIILRGKCLKFDNGKIQIGESMNITLSLELLYYFVCIDDKPKIEIDKLNSIYAINGVDLLANIRKIC